jgi:hypothetical protein
VCCDPAGAAPDISHRPQISGAHKFGETGEHGTVQRPRIKLVTEPPGVVLRHRT